jgi:hypothetical protein
MHKVLLRYVRDFLQFPFLMLSAKIISLKGSRAAPRKVNYLTSGLTLRTLILTNIAGITLILLSFPIMPLSGMLLAELINCCWFVIRDLTY